MDAPDTVVGRASVVLKAIAGHEPHGATTSEIARTVALPRATTHRLLTALLDEGLTDRDAAGRWLLGPELYLLGTAAAARYDVTELAYPVVRRLALETGESAFFSARRGSETVCLLREDGSFPIRSHVLYEGVRFPLGVASAGLVILAHLPDAEIDELLASTDLTRDYGAAHEPARVRERVAATRTAGFATNPGLIVEGSWGMGAAVFDASGRPQWALSLTGIEQRFDEARRPQLGRLLLQAAHELTTTVARR